MIYCSHDEVIFFNCGIKRKEDGNGNLKEEINIVIRTSIGSHKNINFVTK